MATLSARPTNVGSVERIASTAGGLLLALDGLRRGRTRGLAEAAIGAALLQRGATGHCHLYDALGVNTSDETKRADATTQLIQRRSAQVVESQTIQRSPREVYDYWRRLENLPGFMKHLESVTQQSETRSHWVAKMPVGQTVEWDAEITTDVPGERIAWRSLEGSEITNVGTVQFRPAPDGRGTEVFVSLEYAPPAGAIGEAVAKLLAGTPERQIAADLRSFKQIMEAGEVATTEGQPSGRR
jgi:uncharacterized membrane protein